MKFCVIVASNNEAILRANLLASPDLTGADVSVQKGASSSAEAYNRGIRATSAEVMVFAHQDVYLPAGWMTNFNRAIEQLNEQDPQWGVLGVCGLTAGGELRGWVYSTGLGTCIGKSFTKPETVRTLDEVLLVIRRSSGICFDEQLAGFHMYGTDVCLEAEKRSFANYVIPCFLVHNSNGLKQLPWDFWRACMYVRKKWRGQLPVYAPCTTISRFPFNTAMQILERYFRFSLRKRKVGSRVSDPSAIADLFGDKSINA